MTVVSYHDTINELQAADWTETGPFARPSWFALLEQSGNQPFLASCGEGDQAIALILQKSDGKLVGHSNWYAFTYEPLAASPNPSLASLNALAKSLKSRTHRIDLDKVSPEFGNVANIQKAFADNGWIVLKSRSDINHILPVYGRNYAQYIADRPGKLRTTLKRKAKRVEVKLTRKFCESDWAAYEEIYAQSWKPEEGDPRLLETFAQGESAAGRYLFGIATYQGEPVAAQFWTIEQGTAYIHKLAHKESAKPHSPGTTLTAALFQYAIDEAKVDLVDFGTGDDPYKRDWMEEIRDRYQLTILRPNRPANWPILFKAGARKLVSFFQRS